MGEVYRVLKESGSFIKITDNTLVKCGSFQRDFRNSDGSPRKEKVLLNFKKIDRELIYSLSFKYIYNKSRVLFLFVFVVF
jgi:hypothetical protein